MWIPKTELQSPDLGASLSLGSCCPIKRIPSVKQAVAVQCLIRSSLPDFLCVPVCAHECLFVSRVASKKAFPVSVSLPNPKFKQSRIL